MLREQSFADLPPEGLPASGHLDGDIDVVVISDRGTVGLDGPTRTDAASDEADPVNFIEFFRNVGRLRSGVIGGGTYGFGKASFYAGQSGEHDHCLTREFGERGQDQSRFMAAALGQQYREAHRNSTRRYTGRHWWGATENEVVEPVTGATADRLAASLGLRGFDDRGDRDIGDGDRSAPGKW